MKNNEKRRTSKIFSRILIRFIVYSLLLAVVVLGGYGLAVFISSSFIWQADNPVYLLLKVLEDMAPAIIGIVLVGGILALAVFSTRKMTKYLNSMVDAAKSLSHPDDNIIELPEELHDIQNELNLAREQALRNIDAAQEAVQRKNDLIMYLAHDLKTPLASVIGYLTLLRDEGQISEELRQKYLAISLDKAERLEDLINEFFEIARFNLSTITLQYSRINLTRLLEQLVYEFKPMMREKNLSCRLNIAGGEVMLRCDADKMQRVFDNLLRNAVNYSFANTEIRISVAGRGGWLRIRVANQGDTIPEEKLGRIFEQFYRLDAARSAQNGGAGLGLAIAKQIVELHGGTITAASKQETTEFVVSLPIAGKP